MKKERYVSVDVFRGLIVFVMIVVNSPGSWQHIYAPLAHAKWFGCTLTDLVFPGFVFVIGLSMAISFSNLNSDIPKRKFSIKIIKRSLLIFLVGLLLNGFPFVHFHLSAYRFFGVLQRIACSFLLAGLILVYVKNIKIILGVCVGLLLLHWSVLYVFGGDEPYALEKNISQTIDVWLVGKNHLYQGYGIPFDPEGLLGVLSSAAQILMGYLMGVKFIKSKKRGQTTTMSLLLISVFLILLGLLWSKIYPINKSLWTGSYVFFSTGILGVVWLLISKMVQQNLIVDKFVFFRVFGLNPLFSYMLSQAFMSVLILPIFNKNSLYSLLYKNGYQPLFGDYLGSLFMAISYTLLVWIFAYILYKKKIVVKI
ncbi:acyltransferase family protein [Wenyingzhuangia sp. IMCC45467]